MLRAIRLLSPIVGGLLLLSLALLRAVGAAAEAPPAPASAPADPFPALTAELRQAPAPGWLLPGLRLTFYGASATLQGSRHYYLREDTGEWVDDQGRRWSQHEAPAASGHGYTQVNVVAVEPTAAVLDVRTYTFLNATDGPVLAASVGMVGPPGAFGDYWLSPAVLQRVPEQRTANTTIARAPYTFEGKTYQAIRFQYQDAQARHAYVYDLTSGLLLHTNSSILTRGAAPPKDAPPGTQAVGDQTLLTQVVLKSVRQVPVPWAAAAPPPWLRTATQFQYAGQIATAIPNVPAMSMPSTLTMQVKARGANWLQLALTVQTQQVPGVPAQTSQAELVAGLAQIGGLWLPPAAVPLLREGQVLDQDPLTRVTVSVARVGPDAQGRNVVQIAEAGQGQRLDHTYDAATGLLLTATQRNDHLCTQTTYQLTGSQ